MAFENMSVTEHKHEEGFAIQRYSTPGNTPIVPAGCSLDVPYVAVHYDESSYASIARSPLHCAGDAVLVSHCYDLPDLAPFSREVVDTVTVLDDTQNASISHNHLKDVGDAVLVSHCLDHSILVPWGCGDFLVSTL